MGKSSDKTTLGDRMKNYEKQYEAEISPKSNILIRLDGHKFSKFTKGFNRPFDEILSKTMVDVTKDLCEEFNAVTGYAQSDEITLVLPTRYDRVKKYVHSKEDIEKAGYQNYFIKINNEEKSIDSLDTDDETYTYSHRNKVKTPYDKIYYYKIVNNQIYKGRVQKLASLTSSYCSIRFNFHLLKNIDEHFEELNEFYSNSFHESEEENEFREKMSVYYNKVGKAWFDARVFPIYEDNEVLNAIIWRIRDANKNSKSMFSQAYLSHKKLQGLTGNEQISLTKKLTKNNYEDTPDYFRFGTIIKKEKYNKEVEIIPVIKSSINKDIKTVERSRYTTFSKYLDFSKENIDLILRKYL